MNNPCQKCKKQRATVLVTEIDVETNKPREMHLCEACLAESALPKKPAVGVPAVTFATTILAMPDAGAKTKSGRRITCPNCGMTVQEFRLKGRFGCEQCYTSFAESLIPLLEKVHGASQHVGVGPVGTKPKKQSQATIERELLELRRRLNRVVKEEDYEEAARLRDRIQAVERQISQAVDVGDKPKSSGSGGSGAAAESKDV